MRGTTRDETVPYSCYPRKSNRIIRESNANITHKVLRESSNCTGYLVERKLPCGINPLFTSGQLFMHVSCPLKSELENT